MPDISKYYFADGSTMQREYGKTPNGNDMAGRWVLRDVHSFIVDFNVYRNDLLERAGAIVNQDMEED